LSSVHRNVSSSKPQNRFWINIMGLLYFLAVRGLKERINSLEHYWWAVSVCSVNQLQISVLETLTDFHETWRDYVVFCNPTGRCTLEVVRRRKMSQKFVTPAFFITSHLA
jgi:hypothetical protein